MNIILLTQQFQLNNFVTEFNFIEENGEIGNTNVFENKTSYNFDEKNLFSLKQEEIEKLI